MVTKCQSPYRPGVLYRAGMPQGAPAELVDSGGAFARMYMQEAIL